MAKKKVQARTKVKKKTWVPIHAPASFNNILLGESHVTEKEQVLTKSVTSNLMIVADDPRKQSYTVRFDVTDLKDGKANTQVISIGMTPSAVKRLIRRHRDKIMDSFVTRIAGDRLIRVKPLIITRNPSSKAAQTEIRLKVKETLRDMYKKMKFDDIVQDVIQVKTQRLLKDICGKTHPIRTADIKELTVLPQDRKLSAEMVAQMEKEAAEEAEKREQLKAAAQAAMVEKEKAPKKKTPKKAPKKEPEEKKE